LSALVDVWSVRERERICGGIQQASECNLRWKKIGKCALHKTEVCVCACALHKTEVCVCVRAQHSSITNATNTNINHDKQTQRTQQIQEVTLNSSLENLTSPFLTILPLPMGRTVPLAGISLLAPRSVLPSMSNNFSRP
jgi:hypothetical protein